MQMHDDDNDDDDFLDLMERMTMPANRVWRARGPFCRSYIEVSIEIESFY